jgi:hypothetical protein
MWAWMVRGAGDPARARELVAAHPESHGLCAIFTSRTSRDCGRVKQLTTAAQTLQGPELGAMQLAIWGRRIAALELRRERHACVTRARSSRARSAVFTRGRTRS